jgi:N-acetyl-gamma-glutamyl-phosphate reductase
MHTVFTAGAGLAAAGAATAPSAAPRDAAAASRVRIGIAGATGFTGQELLRLLSRHPGVTISTATASSSTSTARTLPALKHVWDGTVTPLDVDALIRDTDLVFLALPDAAAAELAPRLVDSGRKVIDLSGAFRLRDAGARARWYPETHLLPQGLAYGLTEHFRTAIADARMVANPGCYPTATLNALLPLAKAGLLLPGTDIIVDAKSGVSGAGKAPSERTHFSEVHGSMSAYGVLGHRHGVEIEQGLGREVTFTPHLVPLDRGILATIYVRVAPGTTDHDITELFNDAYASEPFIRVVGGALPQINHVAHTNFCDIGWKISPSGRLVLVSVIDNLLKGASGQAIQNMNVMIGAAETTALL